MIQWIASFLKDEQKRKDLLQLSAEPAVRIDYREVELPPETESTTEETPSPPPELTTEKESSARVARSTIAGSRVFQALHQNYAVEMERAQSYSEPSDDREKVTPIVRHDNISNSSD